MNRGISIMAKIYSPVAAFSGVVVGVQFTDGEAETDRVAAIAYFERQGYDVEHDEPAEIAVDEIATDEIATDEGKADEGDENPPADADDEKLSEGQPEETVTPEAPKETVTEAEEPKPATKRSVKPKAGASRE